MFVGADEAGKGPVLGPMVAAAVRADPETLPEDVDDSKRVPPARREELAAHFRDAEDVTVGVAVVGVERIDDPETDMNALTVAAQVDALVQVVEAGDDVVVDAGDVSESRFADRVRDGLGDVGREVELLAEHGADETHAVVGAASVVAKVERDARIDAIAAEYGEVGSGYPSDPTTRDFLRTYVADHDDLPPFARRSWSTSQDVLAAAEQSSLSEF